MPDPMVMFADGGPWMYAVLASTMFAVLSALVLSVAASFKLRVPALLWAVAPACVVAVGAGGTWSGMAMALWAVAASSSEMRTTLASAGLSIGLYPAIWACFAASAALLLTSGSAALATVISAGEDARWSPRHLVVPVSCAILALGTTGAIVFSEQLAAATIGVGLIAACAAAAVALVSVRTTDHEDHAARLASARLLVATLAVLAPLAALLGAALTQTMLVHHALAYASPEMQQALITNAEGHLFSWWLLAPAGLAAAAGLGAVMAAGHHLGDGRGIAGAVGMLAVLALGAAPYAAVHERARELAGIALGGELVHQVALRTPGLPDAGALPADTLNRPPSGNCVVEKGKSGWRLTRRAYGPSACPATATVVDLPVADEVELLLAVAADTPAREVAQTRWYAAQGSLDVLLAPADPAPDSVVLRKRLPSTRLFWEVVPEPAPDAWVIQDGPSATVAGPPGALQRVDAPASLEVPDGVGFVLLLPGPRWTLGDLLAWCGAAQGPDTHRDCVVSSVPEQPAVRRGAVGTRQIEQVDALDVVGAADGSGWLGARSTAPSSGLELARTGMVQRSDPDLMGSGDLAEIEDVITRHMSQIRYCYQRELVTAPSLAGRMVVRFSIASDGSVSSAKAQDTHLPESLQTCVTSRFMRMQFPEPGGAQTPIVRYPLAFSP